MLSYETFYFDLILRESFLLWLGLKLKYYAVADFGQSTYLFGFSDSTHVKIPFQQQQRVR